MNYIDFKTNIKSTPYKTRIKIIHGEDEFFNLVKTIEELDIWAEKEKAIVFYFPTDIERLLSFKNCYSCRIVQPLYIGNYSKEDQKSIIGQILNSIQDYILI